MKNLLIGVQLFILILEAIVLYFYYFSFNQLALHFAVIFFTLLLKIQKEVYRKKCSPIFVMLFVFLMSYFYIKDLPFALNFTILFCFHVGLFLYGTNGVFEQNNKGFFTFRDMKITDSTVFFVITFSFIYMSMTCEASDTQKVWLALIAFFLLFSNFIHLLVSNSILRTNSYLLPLLSILSSSSVAILIFITSGSYVASNLSYQVIEVKVPTPKKNNPKKASKRNPINDPDQVGYSTDLTLNQKTNLKMNPRPELLLWVNPDDRALVKENMIYLKGASFDTFLNRHWSNAYEDYQYVEDGVGNSANGVIRFKEKPKMLHSIRQKVYQLNGWHGTMLAMPNILSVQMDKVLVADNDTYFLPYQTGNKIAYEIESAYTTYRDIADESLEVGQKYKKYLSVYGDASNQIKNKTLEIIPNELSVREKLESILFYFRQNFRYSLVTENTKNLDPLDNFFFHEKKGHCELFATSLVIMARSAGIPARLCVGYYGGTYEPNKDVYIFYSDEAHAWAEIYLNDYGWVVIDSTPVAPLALRQDRMAFEDATGFNMDEFKTIGPDHEKVYEIRWDKNIKELLTSIVMAAKRDPVLMINLILLTYPISFFFIFGIFRVMNLKRKHTFARQKEFPDFVRLIFDIFGKKKKADTMFEYLEQLKEKEKVFDELDDMVLYFYQINYEDKLISNEKEKQFIETLKQIKERITMEKNNLELKV